MPPKNDNDHALVVGIDHYPGYENLKGAIEDAKDVKNWLCDEPDGGRLPEENCKPVYSTPDPTRPIQDDIDDALSLILDAVGAKEQARRLYIYFSGHGMAPSKLVTGMCVANWSLEKRERALNSRRYLDMLLTSGKFREVVMLLDCCRVRMYAAEGRGPASPNIIPGTKSPKSRSFEANATEFLNKAYEAATSAPGQSLPGVRGYFTRALLEGLRGGAAVPPAGVPASELKKYLERRTPELALQDGIEQIPEIDNGFPSFNEPIFGSALPPIPPTPPGDKPPASPPSRPSEPDGGNLSLDLHTYLPGVSVDVRDGQQKLVFFGKVEGAQRLTLPRGFYRVQGAHSGRRIDLQVALTEPQRVQLFGPRAYTAAPLEGSPTSHEYYTYTSMEWGKKVTRGPLNPNPDASVFIYIRAVDREHYQAQTDLAVGLALLDEAGREITRFGPDETKRDMKFGWVALSAGVSAGAYVLRSSNAPAWALPIHTFRNVQTQIFLMHAGSLLFETTKIFMNYGRKGFEPRDDEASAVDTALSGLQNHVDLLPTKSLDLLLHGKFRNPMLGLLGAHALLQRDKIDPRIRIVVHNLTRLLPNSPDVAALHLLARSRKVILLHKPRPYVFQQSPMLRAGLDAVIQASTRKPGIIAKESVIPLIAPRLYADSPWSTWEPLQAEGTEKNLTWVHFALLESRDRPLLMKAKKLTDLAEPARQLGVPPQTVASAIKDLRNMSERNIPEETSLQSAQFEITNLYKTKTKKSQKVKKAEDDAPSATY